MNIQSVESSPVVQIHLPDGQTLEGPRGTTVGKFLAGVKFDSQLVAAVVNNDLRELTYPIELEARVRPVLTDSADGARIYRRSLTFLFEMAFADQFPNAKLFIDHSIASGGYYCQVTGCDTLTEADVASLKAHMDALVKSDQPFEKLILPLQDAVEYFRTQGDDEKISLLKYRKKDTLTLYRLGSRMDHLHGYMVPSTGYIKYFDLALMNGGLVLQFPRQHAPRELQPMPGHLKLLSAFLQYGEWLNKLGVDNVGALNDAIESGRSDQVVLVSEALHEQHIAGIASQIAERIEHSRIILIAGPTSSGKTTTSRRLAVQLLALGISPFPLELDNYFLPRSQTPLDENGKPDFEAIEALNLPMLAENLERLIRGDKVQLPRFNFKSGLSEAGAEVQLSDGQPIILEGIHGLNPKLIPESLRGEAFRMYVSALTQLNLDRHNRVSTTDTRLIRRIVRDARERGYDATHTIGQWESVRHGEKQHIFPFQENADVMFNSALVYELAALKPLAEPLLRQVQQGTPEFIEAKRLLAFLEWFLPLDINLVPETSIVREFLGGSILKGFTMWKK